MTHDVHPPHHTALGDTWQVDSTSLAASKQVEVAALKVTKQDFDRALTEVRPAFGASTDDLSACTKGGILTYGPQLSSMLQSVCASSPPTLLVHHAHVSTMLMSPPCLWHFHLPRLFHSPPL